MIWIFDFWTWHIDSHCIDLVFNILLILIVSILDLPWNVFFIAIGCNWSQASEDTGYTGSKSAVQPAPPQLPRETTVARLQQKCGLNHLEPMASYLRKWPEASKKLGQIDAVVMKQNIEVADPNFTMALKRASESEPDLGWTFMLEQCHASDTRPKIPMNLQMYSNVFKCVVL